MNSSSLIFDICLIFQINHILIVVLAIIAVAQVPSTLGTCVQYDSNGQVYRGRSIDGNCHTEISAYATNKRDSYIGTRSDSTYLHSTFTPFFLFKKDYKIHIYKSIISN